MPNIVGYQLGEIDSDGMVKLVQGEHEFDVFPSFEILTKKGVEIWISGFVKNNKFAGRSFVPFPVHEGDVEGPTFLADPHVASALA